jgi:hypothetical protein
MLNDLYALALVAALIVAPAWVLVWELRHHRTIPPIRVERAERPGWYWACMLTHATLLAFLVLVCAALILVLIVIPEISN